MIIISLTVKTPGRYNNRSGTVQNSARQLAEVSATHNEAKRLFFHYIRPACAQTKRKRATLLGKFSTIPAILSERRRVLLLIEKVRPERRYDFRSYFVRKSRKFG